MSRIEFIALALTVLVHEAPSLNSAIFATSHRGTLRQHPRAPLTSRETQNGTRKSSAKLAYRGSSTWATQTFCFFSSDPSLASLAPAAANNAAMPAFLFWPPPLPSPTAASRVDRRCHRTGYTSVWVHRHRGQGLETARRDQAHILTHTPSTSGDERLVRILRFPRGPMNASAVGSSQIEPPGIECLSAFMR